MTRMLLLLFTALLPFTTAIAAPIQGKVPSGYTTLVISSGKADSATTSSFRVTAAGDRSKLFLLKQGKLVASVIAGVRYKNKNYTYAAARKAKLCAKSGAKLLMGLKSSKKLNVGRIKVSAADGVAYLDAALTAGIDNSSGISVGDKSKCLPDATAKTLGLGSAVGMQALKVVSSTSDDGDGDGLPDILDVDDDDDGVMDSYDSSDGSAPTTEFTAKVFSNLKLEVSQSLNLYTDSDGTLSSSERDGAAASIGLAMQVAGGTVQPTELNCGGLSYCSAGGTGRANGLAFPDAVDSDTDGYGLIANGPTGDFQLQPQVSSSSDINGGDTYIQVVTDSSTGKETEVPVLLNFVFRTTPAVKSLEMGGVTRGFVYPATASMSGSTNNPVVAPAGWDGKVKVTAYRPQRPGIPAASEGSYVDIGNSKISIDIPNAPCTGSGGCSGNGPGNCGPTYYTTTDSNLTASGGTLKDTRGDQDTDLINPSAAEVNFVIDLDGCLASRGLTLSSGQKVALDLQFRSEDGDNAAQKFYISRP